MYKQSSLHRATSLGTEHAGSGLGTETKRAQSAHPGAFRDVGDAVTRLVHADVAVVTEDHLVAVLGFALKIKHRS